MIIFFVEFILPRSTSIFCCKKMWYCWHQFSKNVKFASFGQVLLGMVSLCATLQRHRQMMNSDEAHHFGGQLQKTSRVAVWRRDPGMSHNTKSSAHDQFDHFLLTRTVSGMPYFISCAKHCVIDIYSNFDFAYSLISTYINTLMPGMAYCRDELVPLWAIWAINIPPLLMFLWRGTTFMTSQTAFRAKLHYDITDNSPAYPICDVTDSLQCQPRLWRHRQPIFMTSQKILNAR